MLAHITDNNLPLKAYYENEIFHLLSQFIQITNKMCNVEITTTLVNYRKGTVAYKLNKKPKELRFVSLTWQKNIPDYLN
jgi:hypothetical protein